MRLLLWAIKNATQFLGWNLTSIWKVLSKFLGTKWAAFILLVLLVWLVATFATEMLGFALDLLASYVFPEFNLTIPPAVIQAFHVANYILPVGETLALTASYMTLLAIMTAYRHIKSMIPSPLPGGGGT